MLQNNLLTNYKQPQIRLKLQNFSISSTCERNPQCQHFKNEEVLIHKDSWDTETAAQLLSYFDQGTAWSY